MLYKLTPNSNWSLSNLAHGKSCRSLGVILKEILPFKNCKMFQMVFIMHGKFEILNLHDTKGI